jgi:isorenieratene synthase
VTDPLRRRAAPLRMRRRRLVTPDPLLPREVPAGSEAVVVGGGIAGVSAAVVLAERGVRVTLLEAADHLGGRLGAWPHTLSDGTVAQVEHGFHASSGSTTPGGRSCAAPTRSCRSCGRSGTTR